MRHDPPMHSTRRQLLRSVGLFGATFAVSRGLAACFVAQPSDDGAERTEHALAQCQPGTISRNHGHALVVPPEDVAAGVAKTYSIKGTSGHDHQVTIGADQSALLTRGGTITVESTTGAGHTHSVTVSCQGAVTADAGADSAADGSDSAADGSNGDAGACSGGARSTSISANHGHTLVVPVADLASTEPKTYSIKGSSGHAHQVTITRAQFEHIASGAEISVRSSDDVGHSHVVTVACA
jgi:hypothetical protein